MSFEIPSVCPVCGHKLRHAHTFNLVGRKFNLYFVWCSYVDLVRGACRWCVLFYFGS